MNKNKHVNEFDETLHNSMNKSDQTTSGSDRTLLDQPVKKKKLLYLIPILAGIVATVACVFLAFDLIARDKTPALGTMESSSFVNLQESQIESITDSSIENSSKSIISSRTQSIASPEKTSTSTSVIVNTVAIPKWYSPGTLKVKTLLSTHKEDNTGYSVNFVYTNSLYEQPGHKGCNAPRYDITTGKLSCVNHEIYEAVKGKLVGAISPQSIYVATNISNDCVAVFYLIEREVRPDGLVDYKTISDFYLYNFETKTFVKSPFQGFGMGQHLSSDGTKALVFDNFRDHSFIALFSDVFMFDIKTNTSVQLNLDAQGEMLFYPYDAESYGFSPDGRYAYCSVKWGAGIPTSHRLQNSYAIYDILTKKVVIKSGFGGFSGNGKSYLHFDKNTLYRYQLESGKTEMMGNIPTAEYFEFFSAGYDGRIIALTAMTQELWTQHFKIIKDGAEIRQMNVKAAVTDPQNKYFYWYEQANNYISVMSMETGEVFEISLPEYGYNEIMARIKGTSYMSLYVSTDGKNIALEYYAG